jgi:hypothetical protein
MAEQERYKKLTREELNKLAGEELPERAATSLINANISAPVNAALAANILFDEKEGSGGDEPADKIRQAEPEEKAEKETTEDIDRAFD